MPRFTIKDLFLVGFTICTSKPIHMRQNLPGRREFWQVVGQIKIHRQLRSLRRSRLRGPR